MFLDHRLSKKPALRKSATLIRNVIRHSRFAPMERGMQVGGAIYKRFAPWGVYLGIQLSSVTIPATRR